MTRARPSSSRDVNGLAAPRERVVDGCRKDQPFGVDDAGRQAGPGNRGTDEAKVDVAGGDRLDLIGGDQLTQHEIDVRELRSDLPQERLHVPVDRHGGEADR